MTFRPQAGTRKAIQFVSNPGRPPRLCRPRRPESLFRRGLQRRRRHNPQVSTIGVPERHPRVPASRSRVLLLGTIRSASPFDHQNWLKDSDKQSACTNQTLSLRSNTGVAVLRRERSRAPPRRLGDPSMPASLFTCTSPRKAVAHLGRVPDRIRPRSRCPSFDQVVLCSASRMEASRGTRSR